MKMVEIPLNPVPDQELMITLGGQNCTITVYQRGGRLYLDLCCGAEAVRLGSCMVCAAPLAGQRRHLFAGQLRMADTGAQSHGEQALPHYTGLGRRFRLFYLSDDEEKELAAYKLSAAQA